MPENLVSGKASLPGLHIASFLLCILTLHFLCACRGRGKVEGERGRRRGRVRERRKGKGGRGERERDKSVFSLLIGTSIISD